MKKNIFFTSILLFTITTLFSQNKTALVIGNQNYLNFSKLSTPRSEAVDMKNALERLGFEVILILDGTEYTITDALYDFEDRLKRRGGIALFHYGGHGVQVKDSNYIIPVDARIPDERRVKANAIDVDEVLGIMEVSGSKTNIVILDACRDNPLPSVSRSSSRGLAVVANPPTDSIIVYSADAGTTAQDGLFTPTLLKYIETPGLELVDVLKRVRTDVRKKSGGNQRTGEYNQLESDVFLAGMSINNNITFENVELYGSLQITAENPGELYINNKKVKTFKEGESAKIPKLLIGDYSLEYRSNSKKENRSITISDSNTINVKFSGEAVKMIIPKNTVKSSKRSSTGIDLILVEAGTFKMGSNDGESDEKPVHSVTISKDFYIGKYEVTQKQWKAVMDSNPSHFEGDNLPVEKVSWYDAVEFCNKLSQKEGLSLYYIISGKKVTTNIKSNGYRLPTEAQWEYAAKGGNKSRSYKYAGSNSVDNVAWYSKTTKNKVTKPVGIKQANELGIYDMSGNVYEWCWDKKGSYNSSSQTNPEGNSTGSTRIRRGGSWYGGASYTETTNRRYGYPGDKRYYLGFRLVLPVQ